MTTQPTKARSRSLRRFRRRAAALLAACLVGATSLMAGYTIDRAAAQTSAHVHSSASSRQPVFACGNVIVPQQRSYCVRPNIPRVMLNGVDAVVEIVEQVATTTLTIKLGNTSNQPLEAELVLPVPDGAAVRHFTIGGTPGVRTQEPTARLLPKDEARRIYEEIVREARDPGLLEFAGYNLVRSSVFPVAAGGATVTLTYENLLDADSNRVDYILPRSQSLETSSVKWTVNANIRSKQAVTTVYSPSHEIATRRLGPGELAVSLTNPNMMQPGAFRLSYLLDNNSKSINATLMAYPDPEVGGGYFLLLAGIPSEGNKLDVKQQKREVMIVIDRSGSMKGEKIEQARKAAISIVDGLDAGEAFNIVDYSDSISMFADKAVVKDAKSLADARAYISGLQANGGTNIHDALLSAVRQKPTEGSLPMVLFLTDGLATVGNTSEVDIRNDTARANAAKRRLFTFGVGYDVNAALLDRLASSTRGASINVLPGENVENAVSTVFRRLQGPMLSEPRLLCVDRGGNTLTRGVKELMPGALPDLFEGDQLVVLGQYKDATELRFRIEGEQGGQAKTFEFHFNLANATTRNAFVPRLWATRKIAMLVDEIRQRGAEAPSTSSSDPNNTDPRTRELVEEIVRLSTRFGILTEYTSFLATQPGEGEPARRYSLGYATDEASKNLSARAVQQREGAAGVSQSMNIKDKQAAACNNLDNGYWNDQGQRVAYTTVQQIEDQTLFRRGERWIDARILAKDQDAAPDRVVEFGTPEYFALATTLSAESRAGIIAVFGEVYVLVSDKRVLVKGPMLETTPSTTK